MARGARTGLAAIALFALAGCVAGSAAAQAPAGSSPPTRFAELTGPLGELDRVARLPSVLGEADRDRYRHIFALQEDGAWNEADGLIAALGDRVLMGHVLFQRYMHPTKYRSAYDELAAWLARYGDHPGAERIHRLALKRQPDGAPAPRAPETGGLAGNGEIGAYAAVVLPRRELSDDQRRAATAGRRAIAALVVKGEPDAAFARLSDPALCALLSEAEEDALSAVVARGYFGHQRNGEALALAAAAASRSGDLVGDSHWIAGLAAWRLGEPRKAVRHFAALAEADADPTLTSGGAYWAARAYGRLGEPPAATRMLRLAAEHPRTLYGLLALRVLLESPGFDWEPPRLSEAMLHTLNGARGSRRTIALVKVGQIALAEHEARKLYARLGREAAPALLALADALALPGVQIRLGSQLAITDGRRHERALYPVPVWRPAGGHFTVDPALVLALVRRESNFDSRARSHAGARGLMQLMPRTAGYIDGGRSYRGSDADALFAPELNLALGQKYVRYLLELDRIDDNLIFMLIAYNAGPRRLGQWRAQIDAGDDPLLFIESLPSPETRRFVRFVLANLWIYRHRFGEPVDSLDQLAAGRWPLYRDAAIARVAGAR